MNGNKATYVNYTCVIEGCKIKWGLEGWQWRPPVIKYLSHFSFSKTSLLQNVHLGWETTNLRSGVPFFFSRRFLSAVKKKNGDAWSQVRRQRAAWFLSYVKTQGSQDPGEGSIITEQNSLEKGRSEPVIPTKLSGCKKGACVLFSGIMLVSIY